VSKPRTLVHIGVGKTGTTTLQRNLFVRHRGILSIGRPYANDEFKGAIESLREDDEADYKHSAVAQLCGMAVSEAEARAIALSDQTGYIRFTEASLSRGATRLCGVQAWEKTMERGIPIKLRRVHKAAARRGEQPGSRLSRLAG
jgi:hypothetical protein